MTADEWYMLQATRALNQSIGRVIRHKYDYGAILLCDQRFEGLSFKTALSSWIRPHMKKHNSFGSMIRELRHFFVTAERMVGAESVSCKTYLPYCMLQNACYLRID
jgi:regulator of telomere elongation helicase 1